MSISYTGGAKGVGGDLAARPGSRGMTYIRCARPIARARARSGGGTGRSRTRILLEHADLPAGQDARAAAILGHDNPSRAHESSRHRPPPRPISGAGNLPCANASRLRP